MAIDNERTRKVLELYQELTGVNDDDLIENLLADVRHWCDRWEGDGFRDLLHNSRLRYISERNEQEEYDAKNYKNQRG